MVEVADEDAVFEVGGAAVGPGVAGVMTFALPRALRAGRYPQLGGRSQPGKLQPPSRVASAARWYLLKILASRPKSRGTGLPPNTIGMSLASHANLRASWMEILVPVESVAAPMPETSWS